MCSRRERYVGCLHDKQITEDIADTMVPYKTGTFGAIAKFGPREASPKTWIPCGCLREGGLLMNIPRVLRTNAKPYTHPPRGGPNRWLRITYLRKQSLSSGCGHGGYSTGQRAKKADRLGFAPPSRWKSRKCPQSIKTSRLRSGVLESKSHIFRDQCGDCSIPPCAGQGIAGKSRVTISTSRRRGFCVRTIRSCTDFPAAIGTRQTQLWHKLEILSQQRA